jgi:hypothetical protein
LHDAALRLFEQLEAAFNVERFAGYGLDSELELGGIARPSVRLVPRDSKAAPLTIAFTLFPGLKVRVGRWGIVAFPACGCDACDETANDEATRLTELVDDVTAGRFREGISLPLAGEGWQKSEYWSSRHRHSSRSQVDRVRARHMLAEGERSSIEWVPWPRRVPRGIRNLHSDALV